MAVKANGPQFHKKLGPMRYCYLTSHDCCSVIRPVQTTPEEESCSFQEPEPAGLLELAELQDKSAELQDKHEAGNDAQ